ncbi:MAG: peptidoglycan editing factor PgeF [Silicimonas sp.]|nr:peptidoglycan editing factor PgeF [Silicimonas sp.]
MSLDYITTDALAAFRHGFFTRNGGASSGIFTSLNCGYGASDQRETVMINRARVAKALGGDSRSLVTVYQTHSARAVAVEAPFDTPPEADALVTATPGLVLGILTADCQPVLFADPEARVIGAAHAGWKGALGGVLEATIAAMESLGASRGAIRASIGPSISQRAYEVGPEFRDQFRTEDPDSLRFFSDGQRDRLLFDLVGYGLHRLRQAGIQRAHWTGHCTYSDPDRFYSYRRSTHLKEVDYGRLISAITL